MQENAYLVSTRTKREGQHDSQVIGQPSISIHFSQRCKGKHLFSYNNHILAIIFRGFSGYI